MKLFDKFKKRKKEDLTKFTEEQIETILSINPNITSYLKIGDIAIDLKHDELSNELKEIQDIARRNNPEEIQEFISKQKIKRKQREQEELQQANTVESKIRQNEIIAFTLNRSNYDEEVKAINLYKENISHGIYCPSFYRLASIYEYRGDYDKAIDVAQKGIDIAKQSSKDFENLTHIIQRCNDRKNLSTFRRKTDLASQYESEGKIDEAIKILLETSRIDVDLNTSYSYLAILYHHKKDFENEKKMYEMAIEQQDKSEFSNPNLIYDLKKKLENVTQFLDTGKWKYDCLPSDTRPMIYEVKEAKSLLNSENKDKGIGMLEQLMNKGSYNNTVYYTLYKTYKKDKQYDDAIRVCENAIENLGLFSNDRKSKWVNYLEKVTIQKEKYIEKLEKDKEKLNK